MSTRPAATESGFVDAKFCLGAVLTATLMGLTVAVASAHQEPATQAKPGATPDARPKALPRVYVLATGGTIAGRGASTTAGSNYERGAVSGNDLIGSVPETKAYADLRVEQISNVYGSDITLANWLTLAKRINTIFAEDRDAAGVVVTHGTNTLEETAFFLHLTVRDRRPAVVVGSQRPGTALSADGPANLLGAVRTAVTPTARGKGILTVMNDEINSARDVTKTNSYRPGTFERRSSVSLVMWIRTGSPSTGTSRPATRRSQSSTSPMSQNRPQ